MPIRTPRLLLRPRGPGDAEATYAAIMESWDELHRWMEWAQSREQVTVERLETRYRAIESCRERESLELLGIEVATGQPVVWCGLHTIDWQRHHRDTGFWVRRTAQGRGIASEAANALLRYAFAALGIRRVGLTHSDGNKASRRIAQKLGFAYQGVERAANWLPGGLWADRRCYARFGTDDLPALDVSWGTG